MVKKNKGLLKKIGCILISASILLTGWTFFGSSISIADGDTTILDEVLNEDPDTTEEDVEEVAETEETEESEDAADTSEETTTTFSTDSLELYSLPAAALGTSLASTNDDGTYTADDGATYTDSSMTVLVKVPASVGSTFSVPSSVSTIQSGAFDGSNVTDITFASDATIGSHSSWPANGTVVHAEALTSTSEVVTYFEKLIKAGRNVKILFDESSTTTYSITFEYYKDSISTANKIGTETEEYDEDQLNIDLDPNKIRSDYKKDHDMIYNDESLNRVQKSLALKELLHMSICQVVNDIDLFFTRPYDLTPEENAEKNRQEAKALENELQLS